MGFEPTTPCTRLGLPCLTTSDVTWRGIIAPISLPRTAQQTCSARAVGCLYLGGRRAGLQNSDRALERHGVDRAAKPELVVPRGLECCQRPRVAAWWLSRQAG